MSTSKNNNLKSRPHALSLSQLSISEFTGNAGMNSGNIGVVEVLILHSCDKCIFSKSKWILSMDMINAAKRNLNISAGSDNEENPEFVVVMETEKGVETTKVRNMSKFDPSIMEIERVLYLQTSIFSQMLIKYGLMTELSQKLVTTPMAANQGQLDWKIYSFTTIRAILVSLFEKRTLITIKLKQNNPALAEMRKSNSVDAMIGTVTNRSSSRSREASFGVVQDQKKQSDLVITVNEKIVSITHMPTPLTHDAIGRNIDGRK